MTANALVTQDHIDEYNAFGCVRVEGVFEDRWVEKLSEAIERVAVEFRQGRTPPAVWEIPGNIEPAYYPVPGGEQLNGIMGCAPEFRDWLYESPAAQVVGELTGADDVRFWVDAVFSKQGSDSRQATPWHNDECTYGYKGEQIPSLWMALTDVDEDNAPLLTLAGSNKDEFRYHSPFSPQDVERPADFRAWEDLLARVEDPDADVRSWPAKAGDVLLIHPKTIHGSRTRLNDDGGKRMSFSTRWLGSDARWDPNVLSLPLKMVPDPAMLVPGEPPPESVFPVVWRRNS